MRKNIYPLSPVHAFPAAWSGSARKLKDTSGLHDVTGFWNGKSSQINPARGLQAGILPEKRHFPAFERETRTDMRRMIFRFQPNDLSFSWDWIAYMQKICKTATHIPYKYTRRCSVCYGSPVFGLSDKTKTLSFWTEILPYSNKKTFYETEEQKNKKAKWLLREKYVLLCLCLIIFSTQTSWKVLRQKNKRTKR